MQFPFSNSFGAKHSMFSFGMNVEQIKRARTDEQALIISDCHQEPATDLGLHASGDAMRETPGESGRDKQPGLRRHDARSIDPRQLALVRQKRKDKCVVRCDVHPRVANSLQASGVVENFISCKLLSLSFFWSLVFHLCAFHRC